MKSAILNFLKNRSAILIVFFAFTFGLFLFLFTAPNLTRPALAVNYATNLKTTSSGCDLNNKVTVNFTWAAADKYNGTTDPLEQILDWAVTSDIDAVVGNDNYWGNVTLNVGQSSKTVSGLFAADIEYWWRINTDWGGFLGGWAPSQKPYPNFKFSCTASTINLTSSVSGNTTIFNFSPNANSLTALLIFKDGIADPVKDSGALGNVSSYTWDATGQPSGTYHAQVFVGTTSYSNVANFSLGGAPPPGSTPGVASCDDTTRPTTARQAYDKVWTTAICRSIADQVIFNWGQTTSVLDSLYSLMWAKSQLHPETDRATAGTGAIAATGNLVATLYNPPVSGVNYLAGEFRKLNPVQDAYAQEGIGFGVLTPVQNVWESFRNLSYVGFVIVFVVIGFMIMFRAHISPQAVATLQDSLPRIVVALILVTFSYAIAGLMIDVMFLFLNVALNALPVTDAANKVFTKSVFGVVWSSWGSIFGSVEGAINQLINDTVNFGFIDKILGWFGGTLAGLVIGIALLFIMFKVFITLLISYATIIVLTISAPFFFLLQALPGNNSGQTWFKQMAANIAVFPTVAIMFVLAGYLGNISALGGSGEVFGTEDVAKFPLLAGDISANVLGQLAGIGLLLMTPGAADLVKNAIGAKSPGGGATGAAAGAFLGAGAATVFSGPRSVGSYAGKQATEASARGFAGVGRGAWNKGTSALGSLVKRNTGPGSS